MFAQQSGPIVEKKLMTIVQLNCLLAQKEKAACDDSSDLKLLHPFV